MKKLIVLNGPNLNVLGIRDKCIYGDATMESIVKLCKEASHSFDMKVSVLQSNHEGEIIDWIHDAYKKVDGIVINAGAYTHTSIAIYDALCIHECPIVEVHLSDISKREDFRKNSYISLRADKVIMGKGMQGYEEAITFIASTLRDNA